MENIKVNPKIDESRKKELREEFQKPYFLNIKKFLLEEKQKWKIIYPKSKNIFKAFDLTWFDDVKVVIIGQDPYHWPNQAHWLCFSVQKNVPIPPSLRNIFKEMKEDIGWQIPNNWNLEYLAKQGVLLLNAILTVEAWKAASHRNIWRENFTDAVIKKLSDKKENLVFLLRWNFAISKTKLIDNKKHLILMAAHPSPLSASRGFFWCKHFSKCNKYLQEHWKTPIKRLPN